jgi:peptide subunit release factor 1 (eRF1)
MNTLSEMRGTGTSMVSITIAPSVNALHDTITMLEHEYQTAANIKSRI